MVITKKELAQLYYLNREIALQRERIRELEAAATSCSSPITGLPRGSATDQLASYACEIADLKGLLELNLQKCFYELSRLNRYIATLSDSRLRQIVSLRHISGLSWRQIAFTIGGGNTEVSIRKAYQRFLDKQ